MSATRGNRPAEIIGLALAALILAYGVYQQWGEIREGMGFVLEIAGWTSVVLIPLTVLLAASLLNYWIDPTGNRHAIYRNLGLVIALGPMAGFLGTTFGFMEAVGGLGTATDIDALIQMVGQTLGGVKIALATTAWGLILAMVALAFVRLKPPQNDADAGATEHPMDPAPGQTHAVAQPDGYYSDVPLDYPLMGIGQDAK